MAATRIATDSAAELKDLVGDDVTETFENDPKFIDSDPADHASSENIEVQRDTDDTDDSDEEEDEAEEDDDLGEEDEDLEDEEEDDDDEDFEDDDEDVDDEEADDEEEVGALSAAGTGSSSAEERGEGDEPASDEDVTVEHEGADEEGFEGDSRETDRAVDAALRMQSIVAVTAQFAANL